MSRAIVTYTFIGGGRQVGRTRAMLKAEKVRHVLQARQTRRHSCHWPNCPKQVKPAVWGCYPHWMRLPKYLRDAIWAAYKPGQEDSMDVSDSYLEAAEAVQNWIREHEKISSKKS